MQACDIDGCNEKTYYHTELFLVPSAKGSYGFRFEMCEGHKIEFVNKLKVEARMLCEKIMNDKDVHLHD